MKNDLFKKLVTDSEKLVKKQEKLIKLNYQHSYRVIRDRLNKVYIDYINENGEDVINTMTKAQKIKLDAYIASELAKAYKENKKAVEKTLNDIMDKAYKESFKSVANVESIADVRRKIDSTNVINKEVAGHIWTERIDKYGKDFVYDLHGIVRNGLNNGDTFTSMAKDIKTRFGSDIGNTMRIARTEGARVLEDSKNEAFKDIAENDSVQVFKVWHTMGDEAVRESHEAMEGVRVPFEEPFILPSGVSAMYPKASGVASEDINCRCYVEYVTEVVYNKSVEEIARINGYDPLDASKVVNTLRDDSKGWIDKLTPRERNSINKYTYNGVDPDGKRLFEKINGYLEGRYIPVDKEEEIMLLNNASNIADGLLKSTLKHDIIVYRNDIDPSNLEGRVEKFLSTSVTKRGVLGGTPNSAIIVPEGTSGAYVEMLAHADYKKQREFLFNTDIELKKIANNGLDIYIVKR